MECRKCVYFPCMNEYCNLDSKDCKNGISISNKEINQINKKEVNNGTK